MQTQTSMNTIDQKLSHILALIDTFTAQVCLFTMCWVEITLLSESLLQREGANLPLHMSSIQQQREQPNHHVPSNHNLTLRTWRLQKWSMKSVQNKPLWLSLKRGSNIFLNSVLTKL